MYLIYVYNIYKYMYMYELDFAHKICSNGFVMIALRMILMSKSIEEEKDINSNEVKVEGKGKAAKSVQIKG